MYIAVLFTRDKLWNQPYETANSLCINQWIDKENVIHMHNEGLLTHKEEWNYVVWKKVDGVRDHYIKWNKTKKDKHCMFSLINGV
jgi:hypothetical protein